MEVTGTVHDTKKSIIWIVINVKLDSFKAIIHTWYKRNIKRFIPRGFFVLVGDTFRGTTSITSHIKGQEKILITSIKKGSDVLEKKISFRDFLVVR